MMMSSLGQIQFQLLQQQFPSGVGISIEGDGKDVRISYDFKQYNVKVNVGMASFLIIFKIYHLVIKS